LYSLSIPSFLSSLSFPFPHMPPIPLADQLALERTKLAAERTLLAYVRTALALVAGGLTIVNVFKSAPAAVGGAALMAGGVVVILLGLRRSLRLRRRLLRP